MRSPKSITLSATDIESLKREIEKAYRYLRGDIEAIEGQSGTFQTADTPSKTITVENGIITEGL